MCSRFCYPYIDSFTDSFIGFYCPLFRDFSQPLNTGILEAGVGFKAEFAGRIGGQTAGDGLGNEGGAFFLEQPDQRPLFCQEGVDASGLPVEEVGDGGLFCLVFWISQ